MSFATMFPTKTCLPSGANAAPCEPVPDRGLVEAREISAGHAQEHGLVVTAAPGPAGVRVWEVMSRGRTGRPLPEAMVLKETRSNSQIPTPFPHRFPLNSHALTSVDGLLGQDEIDAAIQTTSTSKARRVDFGRCGPPI